MYFIKTPNIFQYIFKDYIWEIKDTRNTIYITFDDGPHKDITPKVLNILDDYNAKATFFSLGENAEKYPGLIKQIQQAGHSIGNHSYSHVNGWNNPVENYIADVQKADRILNTPLFRPPYGKIRKELANQLKGTFKFIYWTVMPGDFDEQVSKQMCLKRSVKNTKAGKIIVFHENDKAKENMLFTLPLFLEHFSGKGFVFNSIKNEILQ
jgi:peptidoglycan/xylan/chitin deacetylase (PgdA/CDA1 family)